MPYPTTNSSGISNPVHLDLISTSLLEGLSSNAHASILFGFLEFKSCRTCFSVCPVSTISSTTNTSLPDISPAKSFNILTSLELSVEFP